MKVGERTTKKKRKLQNQNPKNQTKNRIQNFCNLVGKGQPLFV